MKFSLKEDINSLSYFKSHFNAILQKMKENHRPLVITQNGKSTGVFIEIETWENVLKKIQLLKLINQAEESLKKGSKSIEQMEEYFNKKYDF